MTTSTWYEEVSERAWTEAPEPIARKVLASIATGSGVDIPDGFVAMEPPWYVAWALYLNVAQKRYEQRGGRGIASCADAHEASDEHLKMLADAIAADGKEVRS